MSECHVQQQRGVMIERPAFYRPPRSRPVGFELPNQYFETISSSCCPKVQVVIKHNHNHATSPQDQETTFISTNSNNDDDMRYKQQEKFGPITMANNYNNLPKPFCRENNHNYSTIGCDNNQYQQQLSSVQRVPKIMINDNQLLPASSSSQQQQTVYPTSTVHKSMLNSGHNNNHNNNSTYEAPNVAYSRLITPTRSPLTTISRSTTNTFEVMDKNKQQHQQGFYGSAGWNSNSGRSSRENNKEAASEFLQATLPSINTDGGANIICEAPTSLPGRQYSKNQNIVIDSSTVFPDSKIDEFMWDKRLERASIAHQTYRTLPIVMPKPKARHDLASGIYMRHVYDPTWDLTRSRPSSANRDHDRRIQEAIKAGTSGSLSHQQQVSCAMPSFATNQATTIGHLDPTNEGRGGPSSASVPFGTTSHHQQYQAASGDESSITRTISNTARMNAAAPAASGFSSKNDSILGVSPVFNYKEYIESTRRAY